MKLSMFHCLSDLKFKEEEIKLHKHGAYDTLAKNNKLVLFSERSVFKTVTWFKLSFQGQNPIEKS